MTGKPRQEIVRIRTAELKHGPNIRSALGSQEELRRLGRSLSKEQLKPLLILPDKSVLDGNRTLAAALLEGIEELDCIVIDRSLTPGEYRQLQWVAAVHRADISPYDKAVTIRDIKADYPGMTNRQLADDILDIDAGLVTKNLTLFDCLPEVQEAAKAGDIGLSAWYEISKSADQLAALAAALNGSTRADLQRANRTQPNGNGHTTPGVRLARIHIPLACDSATGKVTISGDEIDLDAAESLLKEAIKAIAAARKQNLDAKTAQAVWKDMAKAAS